MLIFGYKPYGNEVTLREQNPSYHLTEKFWPLPTYVCRKWPIFYKHRLAIGRIFQLNDNKSETTQDIDLKFSAFVYHKSGLN